MRTFLVEDLEGKQRFMLEDNITKANKQRKYIKKIREIH